MATTQEYALLSLYVYDVRNKPVNRPKIPSGWTPLEIQTDNALGFSYGVFKRAGTGEIVLAYTGTNGDFGDWFSNLAAASGLLPAWQVSNAALVYQKTKANYGSNITLSGHSLGGGLASIMATWFNRPAVVFDEAPFQQTATNTAALELVKIGLSVAGYTDAAMDNAISEFTAREAQVTNHYIAGEVLALLRSDATAVVGSDLPTSVNSNNVNAIQLHSIALLAAIKMSESFRLATYQSNSILPLIMDEKLYAYDTQTSTEKNFLLDLIRSEQSSATNQGKLSHFAADLKKSGSDVSGLTDTAQSAILTQLIEWYYWQGTNYSAKEFFTKSGSLLQYTTAQGDDLPGALNKAKSYVDKWLTPLLNDAGQFGGNINFKQWNVNVGAGTSIAAARDTSKSQIYIGNAGDEKFTGGSQADLLLSGGGHDYLIGGGGNDTLYGGGGGNDILQGGNGFDTYVVSNQDTGLKFIIDDDKRGKVDLDGAQLTGGKRVNEALFTWRNGDIYYVNLGEVLFAARANAKTMAIVLKWHNGDLGITLSNDDDPTPPRPSLPIPPIPPMPVTVSPIVLDLGGDGLETLDRSAGVFFDHGADGFAESTGWVSPSDGLLARDLDHDGKITSGRELFGSETLLSDGTKATNGFYALAELDVDHNGIVDGRDDSFSSLQLWQDINADGQTDEGELLTMEEAGVASISVAHRTLESLDRANNTFKEGGSYTARNGQVRDAIDVWFDSSLTESRSTEPDLPVPADVADLPDIPGYGRVRSLHQAMVRDPVLKDLVVAFGSNPSENNLRDLLWRWSGADTKAANSRGEFITDARWLYMMEAFQGAGFIQAAGTNAGTPNPGPNAASAIYDVAKSIFDYMQDRLLIQTQLKPLYAAIEVTLNSSASVFNVDILPAVALLQAALLDDRAKGVDLVRSFVRSLSYEKLMSAQLLSALKTELQSFGSDVVRLVDEVAVTSAMLQDNAALAGDNNLLGSLLNDTLYGAGGNDTLSGGDGNDELAGGEGNDRLEGGKGADFLYGNNGADTYVMSRAAGQDTIYNADNDSPGVAPDVLLVAADIASAEVRVKAVEDDLLISDSKSDSTILVSDFFRSDVPSAAIDFVKFLNDNASWSREELLNLAAVATEQTDTIWGRSVADTVSGLGGNDVLHGGGGNDVLSGGAGDDSLYGEEGDDTLAGGAGRDYLYGGTGSDTYLFNVGAELDVVDSVDTSDMRLDIVKVGGRNLADVVLSQDDRDLTLMVTDSNDTLLLREFFAESGTVSTVKTIEFTNGQKLEVDDVLRLVMKPTAGPDRITGTRGNDLIQGLGGDDDLRGGDGNDTLDGGVGRDVMYGGAGADTYRFAVGHGSDMIESADEPGARVDTVEMVGIMSSEVKVSRLWGTVLIQHQNGLDSLSISSFFQRRFYESTVQNIAFSDGITWTLGDIVAKVGVATEGNDHLFGWNGTELIKGLQGDDYLEGSGNGDTLDGGQGRDTASVNGTDTYLFGRGDGMDRLSSFGEESASILFKSGIRSQDLVIKRLGNDLVVRMNGSEDQLTVSSYFVAPLKRQDGVLKFVDAPDIFWTDSQIRAAARQGTEGDDELGGDAGADALDGLAGNDTLRGEGGNDTLTGGLGDDVIAPGYGTNLVRFYLGDGHDNYRNLSYSSSDFGLPPRDTIEMVNIASGDVTVHRKNDSLWIEHVNGVDGIEVEAFFDGYNTLALVRFADDVTWNAATLGALARVPSGGNDSIVGRALDEALSGSSGQDTLEGRGGADTLDGGTGNDQLYGDGGYGETPGGDTYLFGKGDGQDTVTEMDATDGNIDVIRFKANVLPGDVAVRRYGGDLIFAIAGSSDTLTIRNFYVAPERRIEQVRFESSLQATWDLATIESKARTATSGADSLWADDTVHALSGLGGNDTLQGSSGDDTLDGGTGDDRLYDGFGSGSQGNDTYLFGRGDGNDLLLESSGNDVIRFKAGVAPGDVLARRSNYDLVLSLNDKRGTVTVGNYFVEGSASAYSYLIEQIRFTDAPTTVWGLSDIKLKIQAGSSEADVLWGDVTDDALNGLEGADLLEGQGGNDSLDGGAGNDVLAGGDGSDVYRFGKTSGNDMIREDGNAADADQLLLAADIAPGDLVLSRANQRDLLVSVTGSTSTMLLKDFFEQDAAGNATSQVESFRFANGTTWDLATIIGKAPQTTPGNDSIEGTSAADTLLGAGGDDTLSGGGGNDLLDGGPGNDSITGGAGTDTIVLGVGSGHDTLGGSRDADVISLEAGLLQQDVSVSRSGTSLLVSVKAGLSTLLVDDYFNQRYTPSSAPRESLIFADGTVWTPAQIDTKAPAKTSGDDVIFGTAANDTLDGGAGDDLLMGGNGADVYLYGRAAGSDTIEQSWQVDDQTDTVLFDADVRPEDVTLTRSGLDLIVKINGATDQLMIRNYFDDYHMTDGSNVVDSLKFSNGTVWDLSKVESLAPMVTDGNDSVFGTTGMDTLDGGLGNDSLLGKAGSDVYVFGRNSGDDTVRDFGNPADVDVIRLDAGILPSDLIVRKDEYGMDLKLTIARTGNTMTVSRYFFDTRNQIEQVQFANGVVWDASNLAAKALVATTGNDTIVGTSGADILNGGTGDDLLIGDKGSDIYQFKIGSGSDTLTDQKYGYYDDGTEIDVLQLGQGIRPQDVTVKRSLHSDDLLVSFSGWSDEVLVTQYFGSDARAHSIEVIQFADGTSWDVAEVQVKVDAAAVNDDTLFGTALADTLDAGLGDDYIDGGNGSDTYVYGLDSGNDVIDDTGTDANDSDVIRFGAGIRSEDIRLSQVSYNGGYMTTDLMVAIAGSSSTLYVRNYFASLFGGAGAQFQRSRFSFADGTVWEGDTLRRKVLEGMVTDGTDYIVAFPGADSVMGLGGDDLISGEAGNDTIVGGRGNDMLSGGAGDDVYVFNRGDGSDFIFRHSAAQAGVAAGEDTLSFGNGISASDLVLFRNMKNLIVQIKQYGVFTSDSLSIQEWFSGTNSIYRIEKFVFKDGSVMSMATASLLATTAALVGNTSASSITGTAAIDFLLGQGGDDTLNAGDEADILFGGLGNDILSGQAGDDILYGESGGDTLDGGLGADTMYGGLGDDRYIVDDVGDLVIEAANGGIDTVDTTLSDYALPDHVENLIMNAKAEVNTASGNALDNYIQGNTRDNLLGGREGSDRLYGAGGEDTLSGDEGNDMLYADSGYNIMGGGEGNDTYELTLLNGMSADVITYNWGDSLDTISLWAYDQDLNFVTLDQFNVYRVEAAPWYDGDSRNFYSMGAGTTVALSYRDPHNSDFSGTVYLNLFNEDGSQAGGIDVITLNDEAISFDAIKSRLQTQGTTGNDILFGFNVNEQFIGGAGDDHIDGAGGRDTLLGGEGNDYLQGAGLLDGGSGNDVIEAEIGSIGSTVLGGAGDDRIGRGESWYWASPQNAGARIDGGAGNDQIQVVFNDTVVFRAGDGSDRVAGSNTTNTYRLEGLKLSDLQMARQAPAWSGSAVLSDNLLIDVISGAGQNQLLIDQFFTRSTSVGPVTQQGRIEVLKEDGSGYITLDAATLAQITNIGNGLSNRIMGDAGHNRLNAGLGNDTVDGAAGNDTLDGGQGNDWLTGGNDYDELLGGDGMDWLSGGNGDDRLLGGADDDNLSDWSGSNTLDGGDGNDGIAGGVGSDLILGGKGNDSLSGGGGKDTLIGGAGSDSYGWWTFANGNDALIIEDGPATDTNTLSLEGNVFGTLFRRVGNDLVMSAMANTGRVTVQDWFLGTHRQLDGFGIGQSDSNYEGYTGGYVEASDVDVLVQAMAGFTPTGGATEIIDVGLRSLVEQTLSVYYESYPS